MDSNRGIFFGDDSQLPNEDEVLEYLTPPNNVQNSNRDVSAFFVNNSQNRSDDEVLLNAPDPVVHSPNEDIQNFYGDDENDVYLNAAYENYSPNDDIRNFYDDDENDVYLNAAYESYLASRRANVPQEVLENIATDHNYSNRVSEKILSDNVLK